MTDIELVETCLTAGICAAGALVFVAFLVLLTLGMNRAAGKADEALGYKDSGFIVLQLDNTSRFYPGARIDVGGKAMRVRHVTGRYIEAEYDEPEVQ